MNFLYYFFLSLMVFCLVSIISPQIAGLKQLLFTCLNEKADLAEFFFGSDRRHSLERSLKKMLWKNEFPKEEERVSYKYFSELIERGISQYQSYGADYLPLCQELLNALTHDKAFEEKYLEQFKSDAFQYALISLIIIGFAYFAQFSLQGTADLQRLVLAILSHFIGFCLYGYTFLKLRVACFRSKFEFLKSLEIFIGMYQVGCSIDDMLQSSRVLELKLERELLDLYQNLQDDIKTHTHLGVDLSKSLLLARKELWAIIFAEQSKLERTQSILKTLILLIFFLPSYFLLMLQIVNDTQF